VNNLDCRPRDAEPNQGTAETAGGDLQVAFTCQRCGACCREPGIVVMTLEDIVEAAGFLGLGPGTFRTQYDVTNVWGRDCIDIRHRACPFLENHDGDSSCTLEAAKPEICRSFPHAWAGTGYRTEVSCPGLATPTTDE